MSTSSAEHPQIETVLLLMVSGMGHAALVDACVSKLEIAPAEAEAVIAEARRKLTLAADYNRDEGIGTAVTRLNDLYARAIRAQDIKTALAAQKELNHLQGLYREEAPGAAAGEPDAGEGDAGADPDAAEIAAIRGHLMPLALAAADYPLREHARIAADIVREHLGTHPRR